MSLRAAWLLPLIVLLPHCAAPPPPDAPACPLADRGIGGTGIRTGDRGIGGTGIGGTGIATAEIAGTLTGFASLCVDGLEIALAPTASLAQDGAAAQVADLRIGQQLRLIARHGDAGLRTEAVSIRHEVIGPVEARRPDGLPDGLRDGLPDGLIVAGQPVRLGPATPGAALAVPGAWLAVSGLRGPDGAIAATRLDPAEPGRALIAGVIRRHGAETTIGTARLRGLPSVPPAGRVVVAGAYRDGVLTVARARPEAAPDPAANVVVLEAVIGRSGDLLQIGDALQATDATGAALRGPIQAIVTLTHGADGGLVATGLSAVGGASGPDGRRGPAGSPGAPAPGAPGPGGAAAGPGPEAGGRASPGATGPAGPGPAGPDAAPAPGGAAATGSAGKAGVGKDAAAGASAAGGRTR